MNVKEMQYINEHESYDTLESSRKVLLILGEEVNNYKEEDINICKERILNELKIKKGEVYELKKCKKREYIVRANDINNLTKEELSEVIKEIKNKYIYDEAILRLVNENKLIPISTIDRGYYHDILIDAKGKEGNKCYYLYLDFLCIYTCRISVSI